MGEIIALPRPPSWICERIEKEGRGMGRGRAKKEEEENGRRGREGRKRCKEKTEIGTGK